KASRHLRLSRGDAHRNRVAPPFSARASGIPRAAPMARGGPRDLDRRSCQRFDRNRHTGRSRAGGTLAEKGGRVMRGKYVFITGGVVCSLGKGIAASSIGALLEARGYSVALAKFDPYINVDPGTMSPFQHGEVYVTDDGAETDLDLGHYERFTSMTSSRAN